MADPELKLHGFWGSPFSRRVEIALNLKGILYEYMEEDLQNKSLKLLKYNHVHKKVPLLLHEGRPLAESQVIIEYIDETWKSNPILPLDPCERATARFWARFIDDKCFPSLTKALWGPEEEQEQAEQEARENLANLEKELQGKRFFGGSSIGFLDIIANFIGYWLEPIQEAAGKAILTKESFPLLCKWKDEFIKISIIKENLPPRDRLVAFYRIRIEAAKAFK